MPKKSQAVALRQSENGAVRVRPKWAEKLDEREFAWVTEYLVDLNAGAAARRAFPENSPSSCYDAGYQMRQKLHVVEAIDAAMAASVAGPRQWMVGKLAAIAEGDLSEFLMVDENNKVRLLKPWAEIPSAVRKLFKRVYNDKNGLRIDLHDPIKAMELLSKVVPGMVVENVDLTASVTLEALVLGALKLKSEKKED